MLYSLKIFFALLLDAVMGDPQWYPHPVRFIGRLCELCEKYTRIIFSSPFLAGIATVFTVVMTTYVVSYILIVISYSINTLFGDITAIVLLYTTIAAKDLLVHSNAVYIQLITNTSLAKAREEIAKIVGRDTHNLDCEQVCRACIETVAENMVDGITSPLFFAIVASLFSPFTNLSPIGCSVVGAFMYKAVNTLDSMIGYKNDKYIDFGKSGAKLDDWANFIPARLSGLCLIIAAFFLHLDYRGAARIFFRDRLKHSSPNGGHSEAVLAGGLGIRLGGPSSYMGKVEKKPFLGDENRQILPVDIRTSHQMVIVGSFFFVFFMLVIRSLLLLLAGG